MSIEPVNGELVYSLSEIEKKKEGSDGQRTYTPLESREYCIQGCNYFGMHRFGIDKISFQVYQLTETTFFDIDFNVSISGDKPSCLHFSNKTISTRDGMDEFFSEVKTVAAAAGALGLVALANQAAILSSRGQLPPGKDSQYFRCMESCDRIEFEPFKLLCYLACTIWADETPGS